MAEYHNAKTDYILKIDGAYENTLDVEGFAQMMKDPSYCYKFYWLEAIVNLIAQDVAETTFDEIIDEMIANAWYSVREFHIHLSGMQADGKVRDGLERAILRLTELSDLPANASKLEIKNAIREYNDELWNLMPMDSTLNSSKNNRLPKWDPFFRLFAENQYVMYEMIQDKPELHKKFENCYRDNLHSIWAIQELYRSGNSLEKFFHILQENMKPVYDSARRQGYEVWER